MNGQVFDDEACCFARLIGNPIASLLQLFGCGLNAFSSMQSFDLIKESVNADLA